MIGLSANRLSASRLAGLREASQFRNGQWLEGAGSWFSPYSAAATAALVAAFPTQWPTIRDYGWQHPALVPFINEDPMLVMSLIDGLGTRYLVGDGASCINTDIIPRAGLTIESIVSGTSTSTGSYYGVVHNFNGSGMWFSLGQTAGWMVNYTVGAISITRIQSKTSVKHTFAGSLIVDGVNKGSKSGSANSSHGLTIMANFDLKSDVMTNIGFGNGIMLAEWTPKLNGTALCKYVPFVSTTRNGMLDIHDLEHPIFHPNQGTGTFTTEEVIAS